MAPPANLTLNADRSTKSAQNTKSAQGIETRQSGWQRNANGDASINVARTPTAPQSDASSQLEFPGPPLTRTFSNSTSIHVPSPPPHMRRLRSPGLTPGAGSAPAPAPEEFNLFSPTSEFQELRRTSTAISASNGSASSGATGVRARHSEKISSKHWLRQKAEASWYRNKGLILVVIAQVFGTLMNVTTRVLETGSDTHPGMHPFQILFARMGITSTLCFVYMWWQQVPDWPLGAKGVRRLLVFRGLGGFWGVYGLYGSLQYLALADATVLTFLGPTLACWVCSKLLAEPFTRVDRIGGLVSLLGVVLIARPTSIFASTVDEAGDTNIDVSNDAARLAIRDEREPAATSMQRLYAVGLAMVGVLGASVAYTTIRMIGQRAPPLISVNYFAFWCTIVSAFFLAFIPAVPFVLPHGWWQWMLLFFIGMSGFVMQLLLTSGLAYEKSSRATNMVYSQMLFALMFDKIIWDHSPGIMSLLGSGLILGSALVVAMQKDQASAKQEAGQASQEEHAALMEEGRESLELYETDPDNPRRSRSLDTGEQRP